MSRAARSFLPIPAGVEVSINLEKREIKAKGAKGVRECHIPSCIILTKDDQSLKFASAPGEEPSSTADAILGTTRALVRNLLEGVSKGYEKKLILVGVGYRAQVQGKVLNLQLGFSHPVKFNIPDGIVIEAPSQTEVVVRGMNKEQIGEVAAQIRAFRPPEPYKGKGIHYDGEIIVRKEGKKK